MIEVKRCKGGISIEGHAGYAPHGQDIVCAAVSVLAQNLVMSLEELTGDEISYDMQSGMIHIQHGNLSSRAQVLIDSFFIGVKAIADNYPDNVRVEQA